MTVFDALHSWCIRELSRHMRLVRLLVLAFSDRTGLLHIFGTLIEFFSSFLDFKHPLSFQISFGFLGGTSFRG